MNRNTYWLGALVGLLAISGCGDDASATTETDTEGTTTTGEDTTTDTTTMSTSVSETLTTTTMSTTIDPDTGSSTDTTGPPPEPADFFVRIENISDTSVIPGPLSPGLWLEHGQGTMPIFTLNEADRGEGLVSIAEDGVTDDLAAAMGSNGDVVQVDTWADPILPGEMLEFEFTAQPFSRLSLVTMLVRSNDIFVGSGPNGISIFDNTGFPQDERDVTMNFRFWDVGSEYNQAPGQGFDQILNSAPNVGMDESGQVVAFNSSTRAMPFARAFFDVAVEIDELNDSQLNITFTNISEDRGTLVSDFSGIIWARHDDSTTLFGQGDDPADVTGLEELAEDGDTSVWFGDLDGNVAEVDEIAGPVVPGDTFQIQVTPDDTDRFLSLATMIVQTNDAFLAPWPGGVELADDQGALRPVNDIRLDFERQMVVWDAGSEANEAPGRGANIAARQINPGDGPVDPDATIRPYSDTTNDFATTGTLGGLLTLEITPVPAQDGDFDIVLTNTSAGTAFEGIVTPMAWMVHDGNEVFFDVGEVASAGLELLAEDGDAVTLEGEVSGTAAQSGIEDTPNGAGAPAALQPGEFYSFQITGLDGTDAFFDFASMIVPSNDTFVSFPPGGIQLMDGATPRAQGDIDQDIADLLSAWESGTEANQCGGGGRDMPPAQAAGNTGEAEGTGIVRFADDTDPIWVYPEVDQVLRITVGPVE